jgi:hypothetical protein
MSRDTNPAAQSATQIGVLVGEDWQVTCHTYKWTTPILSVRTGSETISISARPGDDMPEAGVNFAHEMVRQAQRFAAECERLHALNTKASGENSAPDAARLAAGRRA